MKKQIISRRGDAEACELCTLGVITLCFGRLGVPTFVDAGEGCGGSRSFPERGDGVDCVMLLNIGATDFEELCVGLAGTRLVLREFGMELLLINSFTPDGMS